MIEALLDLTTLPDLHPGVVHFPIAFLPLALAFEGAGLFLHRQRWLAPALASRSVGGRRIAPPRAPGPQDEEKRCL